MNVKNIKDWAISREASLTRGTFNDWAKAVELSKFETQNIVEKFFNNTYNRYMNNNWSTNYSFCKSCKSTERRHMAKGLCGYCYLKQYHNDPANIEKVREQKNKHYLLKQKPRAKQVREKLNFDGMRETVLLRDNYSCTECGFTGKSSELVVHHRDVTGRNKPVHNNSLDNLTTLCRACHLAEHRDLVLGARFQRGVDGWAKHHDACIDCGTTTVRHYSHGRCVNCRAKHVRNSSIV